MKHKWIGGVLLLGGAMAGCASHNDSPFAGLKKPEARALSQRLACARDAALEADLRTASNDHAPRNVLVLSGGGPFGAFGCGVLEGWRSAPEPRPQFDVVTGISTGALMAVSAFLGEAQDDQRMREVYTTTRDADVFEGPLTVGHPDSLFDTRPLERMIARTVTDAVIGRVAAAHAQGRRLYVATVGLNEGRLVIWPLSRIAADALEADRVSPGSGAPLFDRFRRILLATAAIPVVFPPVELDGDLHADAGLHAALFLRDAMLGSDRMPGAVYAIVNERLRADPKETAQDVLHVGIRSLDLYMDGLQFSSLRSVALTAQAHHPQWQFRYVNAPPDLRDEAAPGLGKATFDPVAMKKLYHAGEVLGRRGAPAWLEGTPADDGEMDHPPGKETVDALH